MVKRRGRTADGEPENIHMPAVHPGRSSPTGEEPARTTDETAASDYMHLSRDPSSTSSSAYASLVSNHREGGTPVSDERPSPVYEDIPEYLEPVSTEYDYV